MMSKEELQKLTWNAVVDYFDHMDTAGWQCAITVLRDAGYDISEVLNARRKSGQFFSLLHYDVISEKIRMWLGYPVVSDGLTVLDSPNVVECDEQEAYRRYVQWCKKFGKKPQSLEGWSGWS